MTEYLQALPSGIMLHEYRIDRVLGSGGFGITYLAWDTNLEKAVAIKEFLPGECATRTDGQTVVPNSPADKADYEWGLKRFLDEARTLARFNHENLNKVYRFFQANATAYLVLEYIEGKTLSDILKVHDRIEENDLKYILRDIVSGLAAVHATGMIHRDIKPSNIMLRDNGRAVLLDFGAARYAIGQHSKSLTSVLTPGYAPIEQYDRHAQDVGAWSDIYALGMVAYRAVCGSNALIPDAVTRARLQGKGKTEGDLIPAHQMAKADYSQQFLQAIDWAVSVNEEDRPQSLEHWRVRLLGAEKSAQSATPDPKPLFRATFAMMGCIAKADGRVSEDEIRLAEQTMQQMRLDREQRQAAIGHFNEGKSDDFVLSSILGELRTAMDNDRVAMKQFVQTQLDAAFADGEMHPNEESILRQCCELLGLDSREFPELGRKTAASDKDGTQGRQSPPTRPVEQPGAPHKEKVQPEEKRHTVRETVQKDKAAGGGNHLFSPSRRLSRLRYFIYSMTLNLVFIAIVVGLASEGADDTVAFVAMGIVFLPIAVLMTIFSIQRLHDFNSSGWLSLILLLPAVGALFYLALWFIPGTDGPNRFGQKQPPHGGVLTGFAVIYSLLAFFGVVGGLMSIPAYLAYVDEAEQARQAMLEAERQRLEEMRQQELLAEALPEMVELPGGEFKMGSHSYGEDEQPSHWVNVSPFAMSATEVTFDQYDAFAEATGRDRPDDEGWGRGSRPVVNVNWHDAQAFVEWLSETSGDNYRLPTEAEWEYAARAGGSDLAYSWGDDVGTAKANCNGCGSWYTDQTAPVASFSKNDWDLYDMHGNVAEWTQDCWNPDYSNARDDGQAMTTGECGKRVVRGGHWNNDPNKIRSGYRGWGTAENRNGVYGIRVARDG